MPDLTPKARLLHWLGQAGVFITLVVLLWGWTGRWSEYLNLGFVEGLQRITSGAPFGIIEAGEKLLDVRLIVNASGNFIWTVSNIAITDGNLNIKAWRSPAIKNIAEGRCHASWSQDWQIIKSDLTSAETRPPRIWESGYLFARWWAERIHCSDLVIQHDTDLLSNRSSLVIESEQEVGPARKISDRKIVDSQSRTVPFDLVLQGIAHYLPLSIRNTGQNNCERGYNKSRNCRDERIRIVSGDVEQPTSEPSVPRYLCDIRGICLWMLACFCAAVGMGLIFEREHTFTLHIQMLLGFILWVIGIWLIYHGALLFMYGTWAFPSDFPSLCRSFLSFRFDPPPSREALFLVSEVRTRFQFIVFADVAVEVNDFLLGFAFLGHWRLPDVNSIDSVDSSRNLSSSGSLDELSYYHSSLSWS
jgi:hypothetical protein